MKRRRVLIGSGIVLTITAGCLAGDDTGDTEGDTVNCPEPKVEEPLSYEDHDIPVFEDWERRIELVTSDEDIDQMVNEKEAATVLRDIDFSYKFGIAFQIPTGGNTSSLQIQAVDRPRPTDIDVYACHERYNDNDVAGIFSRLLIAHHGGQPPENVRLRNHVEGP